MGRYPSRHESDVVMSEYVDGYVTFSLAFETSIPVPYLPKPEAKLPIVLSYGQWNSIMLVHFS